MVTEIKNGIYYVGVNDRNKHRFEGLWPLPNGVSYNSYVIVDEKVTLVDTVEVDFFTQFLENIKEVIGEREIDYLVINHMEPDHSGSIALNGSFQTQTFVGGTIDVLMEHISHSLLLQPQSRVELIVTLQWCLVLQIHPRHDCIHSLAVHLGKAQSTFLQKEVPGVLHIVQVVGIVDDSLYVALIVAHFHLGLKYVFHNLYVAYFGPKNPLFEGFISKSLQK